MKRSSRAAVAVFCLSAAARRAPAQAAEITLMGYRGAFEQNYVKAVIEPFMKAHPDISVVYAGVQNAAAALGNLRAQKSSPQANAVIIDLSVAKIARDEGLLAELDLARIPAYGDLADLGRTWAPRRFR